jgi:hypothetical protein
MEYEGIPTSELIRLAKDAANISTNKGFLKDGTNSYNNFEPRPYSPPLVSTADTIYGYEVHERREKLLDKVTGSEAEILRNTTFTSSKKDIEEYIEIISKLLKAGVFDDNERQKKAREDYKKLQKNLNNGKKVI